MYVINGWILAILVSSTLLLLALFGTALFREIFLPGIKRREDLKENRIEVDRYCLLEDVEIMESKYPGIHDGETLLRTEAVCKSMLDGVCATQTALMDSLYDELKPRMKEDAREFVENQLQNGRTVISFATFCQAHAINAYLSYLQNGEIFFEETPGSGDSV